jgi:O-antigen biosynthesis protein
MTVAQRVQPLLVTVAPPGSTRRRVLRSGYRAITALPRLLKQRTLAHEIGSLGRRLSSLLSALFHRDQAAARSRRAQVLVIDHRLPTPDRDSGSFRIMELIRAIQRRGHEITFIPDNWAVFSPYLEDLLGIGVKVVYPPIFSSPEEFLKKQGGDFSLAIISRADVAERHMDAVRRHAPQARIVFDTVDLAFMREERQAQIGGDPALVAVAASRKEQELRLARSADVTLVVSSIEKVVLEAECGGAIDVRILSNIHPVERSEPPGYDQRRDILFIGGFDHAPNVDAVVFFAQVIFPRVRECIPDVVFQVIGPYPTPEICRLASPSIHILGFVPDVKPIFDKARLSVAPLRFGAGVKGKVNQSMSFGVPTVVTSMAAEGMYLTHEVDALIADDPANFADAVVRLWTSPELWRKVSKNGLHNLHKHFSVEAATKPIDELLAWARLPATANIEEERGDERATRRARFNSGSSAAKARAS